LILLLLFHVGVEKVVAVCILSALKPEGKVAVIVGTVMNSFTFFCDDRLVLPEEFDDFIEEPLFFSLSNSGDVSGLPK